MAFQKKETGAANKAASEKTKSGNVTASSGTVILTNMSTNPILLREGANEVMIQPREMKTLNKDVYLALKKNGVISTWLDQGLLRCNYTADIEENVSADISVSAEDAPQELQESVEKTDGVTPVSAEVIEQKPAGNITLD